jgi:type I restriction enzyme S subunit
MKGWRECRLEEVADRIGIGPFGSNIKISTFVNSGIPVISGTHLRGIRLEDKEYNYITLEHANKLLSANVYPGDIIFTHAGNIGQVAFIPKNAKYDRYIISQRQFYLRCRKDALIPEYLTYYFKSNEGQYKLLANANQTGVPSLAQPVSYLKTIEILLPPLPEQRAIAGVLSSLDDKIDVLHRQNKTLEGMAEALWRKMFVEEAETGWPERKLEELCTITRGASPRPIIQYVINGTVPWIKIADATASGSYFIDKTKEFIVERGVSKSVQVFPGDLILSNSATCGFPYFVKLNGCIHDGWLLFRDFKGISKTFVFFFMKQLNDELNYIADGSVQNNLNTGLLKEYKLKVPSVNVIDKFDAFGNAVLSTIRENGKQIRTLEILRDMLLPKLMSGEIRVKVKE